ncbi:RNA polymerase sigma factor [Tessaracoccus antarcticus]|uniref:RNA polymerase sigma factor n=1 Tax=Tessaracoccus antarcticus TaxID=2479848 RepID=A0A3M0FXU1_9ACTN|nr:sigma-70 family RNA polymerase sigma factor [Tessaracoccus antarcticus]RMB57494.1 sigma-70 family RNA polymerase sigma factor [Tessaracoccus antarcticus]
MTVESFPSPVAALATRLASGDETALHEAFTRWSRLVHTIARSALGSSADADDVTQQVFIAAWKSRTTLRPSDEALPAWLLGIAKFKITDALRARTRTFRAEESAKLDASPEIITHVNDVLDRVVVRDALESLGDPRGQVLRMVFLEDKTHDVVSRELGIPLGTVKSHVRRGLEKLRNIFEEVDSLHA